MISPHLQKLFGGISQLQADEDWSSHGGPRFVTNQITSKVSSFYERLRYVVDYHEEHMLRRAAIERILRRLVLFGFQEKTGRELLEELVRARYVDNDVLPEDVSKDVHAIIEKYARLEKTLSNDGGTLWSYAAVEIERHLFPTPIDELTFQALFNIVKNDFAPKQAGSISEKAFALQVYIACRRVFMRESHAALNYSLFLKMFPEWKHLYQDDVAIYQKIANNFTRVQAEIYSLTKSRVQWSIAARLKNEGIYFNVIRDIVKNHGRDAELIFADSGRLETVVADMMGKTYRSHTDKITRSGTRAILYILITKVIIGLAVELPYEVFVLQDVNYIALAINLALFPILMVLMTKTVSYPDKKNTDKIIAGIQAMVRDTGETQKRQQYIAAGPRTLVQKFSYVVFFTTFFSLTFGAILYVLSVLHFNYASVILFLLFLCIVTYMGLHIRSKAREWTIEAEDESFFGLLSYLLLLPITSSGQWISQKLSSMNIFVFFMDFILETPFKVMLSSFDAFISYTKELKRDGI